MKYDFDELTYEFRATIKDLKLRLDQIEYLGRCLYGHRGLYEFIEKLKKEVRDTFSEIKDLDAHLKKLQDERQGN